MRGLASRSHGGRTRWRRAPGAMRQLRHHRRRNTELRIDEAREIPRSHPVHVLVRPRGGDFVYSNLELDVMKADIDTVGELGFQGVAIGALTPSQKVDVKAMHLLLEECRWHNLAVTFHRAFDCAMEPLQALELIATSFGNVGRVLTSGQECTAVEGVPLLRALLGSIRVSVLPGAGITAANASSVVRELGVSELQGSVRKEVRVSPERSLLPGETNAVIWTVDADKVQSIVSLCKSVAKSYGA